MLAFASATFESSSQTSISTGAKPFSRFAPTVQQRQQPFAVVGSKRVRPDQDDKVSYLDQEYASDILEWLLSVETRTLAIPEYMQNQTQLTWKMRKTLVLWLVQVSLEFSLTQETLYLAINLLDRVSSKRSILSRQYQLLGLCCLWIAAKVHENHGRVPTIKKLMYICCQTYTFDNFVVMERFVLIELGCYLNHVSTEEFVSAYSVLHHLDLQTTCLARYFVEQSLIHKRFVGVRPSLIARSAINLASCIANGIDLFGPNATEHDQICQAHLKDCLRQQPVILVKKFGGPEYHFSSRLVEKFQVPSHFSTSATSCQPFQQNRFMDQYGTINSVTGQISNHGLLTPPKDDQSSSTNTTLTIPSLTCLDQVLLSSGTIRGSGSNYLTIPPSSVASLTSHPGPFSYYNFVNENTAIKW